MTKVIGREDEFRLENKVRDEMYNFSEICKGINEILKESDIKIRNNRLLQSHGKLETCGYGFEVTTPAVEIRKGCSHKLTLSTLAHRMALIYAFREYCKRNKEKILIYGWSSHESVPIGITDFDRYHLANVISQVLRATIGPVLIALYKARISCYSVGVKLKSSNKTWDKLGRLQFYTEYIPDHMQLSAANVFLVGTVGKLEELVKKFITNKFGVNHFGKNYKPEEYREFYRNFDLRVNTPYLTRYEPLWLSNRTKEILREGLRAKIPIIDRKSRKRELTLGYLFRYWLDFFGDDIKKYATEKEIKTLEELSVGEKKLILDYEWPPHHYDIDESYFKTFTRDKPAKYFKKQARIGLKGWC